MDGSTVTRGSKLFGVPQITSTKYNRGCIFIPKTVNAVRVTHCAIPRKGVVAALVIIDSVVQCANAQRKSAATRASHVVRHLYKWCLLIVHTPLKRHTHFNRHTHLRRCTLKVKMRKHGQ